MNRLTRAWFLLFALCLPLLHTGTAEAVVDIYEFENEALRERYLLLVEELRCPKCQNQNLAGSDSPISQDLRREVHRLLQEGQSDSEIKDYMVARYGDYVLYRPKFNKQTLVLWLGPLALLLLGALIALLIVRRQTRPVAEVDEARLKQLLEQGPNNSPQDPQ
ncbi:MAG: cytochrome c-type biogenesis protein CcmH [Cellvibrionaceae bacterium]|nr:cytochrome c-type biogenesis protein CcmH [Cellvibrionaceae bacterium]MCV6626740.1 cytochrome c-type biogenesis protein CcmH [Cellvibrionaceae bacterium]